MNEFRRTAEEDLEIRGLLQTAGPRPEVPSEDFETLKAAARKEWVALVESERRSGLSFRWGPALALAASLAVALVGAWWWSASRAVAVASFDRVSGQVGLVADAESASATASVATVDSELRAGVVIETAAAGASRAALTLADGSSIRLDEGSRLRIVSSRELELAAGAVYFDSGADGAPIAIRTDFGTVRNVGTRFEVRLGDGSGVTLRVRQGRVALESAAGVVAAAEGEELVLDREGSVTRSSLAPTAPEWAWLWEIAPPFELDGASLGSFLDWVSAESGLLVRYEDGALAESAREAILSGDLNGMTPTQAVGAIVPSTGLDHRLAGGEVYISRPAG